jgi:hypothetical protein
MHDYLVNWRRVVGPSKGRGVRRSKNFDWAQYKQVVRVALSNATVPDLVGSRLFFQLLGVARFVCGVVRRACTSHHPFVFARTGFGLFSLAVAPSRYVIALLGLVLVLVSTITKHSQQFIFNIYGRWQGEFGERLLLQSWPASVQSSGQAKRETMLASQLARQQVDT